MDWTTDATRHAAPCWGKPRVRAFFEAIGRTGPATELTPLAFLHHYWRFRDGRVCFVPSSEDTAALARPAGSPSTL